jgi:exodeoxyribonuclease V gamma subunit
MVLEGEIESYDDYIKAFKDERKSPWKFFAGKKLFDIKNVCGFTEKYFKELWDIEVNNLKELTPGLWNADKDMGGAVDVDE